MSADWTKRQSQAIDLLRFPMAAAVVVLHYSLTQMSNATGSLRMLCIFFQEGICRLAVPCFFFISGYLFFHQLQIWNRSIWLEKLKRRIHTLLIPYILWIIIDFFAYWFYALFQGNAIPLWVQFVKLGGIKIFWSVNGGIPLGIRGVPLNGSLWFIRDLMFFNIAAPLIHLFVTKSKHFGILVVCSVFLTFQGIIPEGFVFYLAGAYLQIAKKNISQIVWPKRKILYVTSFFLLIALSLLIETPFWGRFIKNLFLFVGIGSIFCISISLSGKTRINPFLVRSSFFIFATHEILILRQIAIPLVNRIPFCGPGWDCIRFFLTPTLTVCICLVLLYLMEQLLPRTTSILIGRNCKGNYIPVVHKLD